MTAPGGPHDPGNQGPTPVPTMTAVWRWLVGLWWMGVRAVVG